MRTIILILIVGILAVIAAISTGFLNIDQIRGAKAPQVSATHNGIVAKGGQAPAFDVETGSVRIGTRQSSIKVPSLEVVRPANGNEAANAPDNASGNAN
ncbi:MAG: hypothetical protein ABIW33_04790 [Sphingomicrobium sp.]